MIVSRESVPRPPLLIHLKIWRSLLLFLSEFVWALDSFLLFGLHRFCIKIPRTEVERGSNDIEPRGELAVFTMEG